MFTVCVWFGTLQTPWAFVYQTRETAEEQVAEVNGERSFIVFEDDFGQQLTVKRDAITGVLIDDMKKSSLGKIEVALHTARAQANYNSRAQADPTLRLNGAPMIQPMGLGGMRGN